VVIPPTGTPAAGATMDTLGGVMSPWRELAWKSSNVTVPPTPAGRRRPTNPLPLIASSLVTRTLTGVADHRPLRPRDWPVSGRTTVSVSFGPSAARVTR